MAFSGERRRLNQSLVESADELRHSEAGSQGLVVEVVLFDNLEIG